MTVFPDRRRRQAQNILSFSVSEYAFKSKSRNVMTFINNDLTVLTHDAIDLALADQALHDRDIDLQPVRFPAATDLPNFRLRESKERLEPVLPLIQ